MRTLAPAVFLAFLLAVIPAPAAAQQIDTRSGGTQGIYQVMEVGGPPAGTLHTTESQGQTFTVEPGWASLTSFSFWLHGDFFWGIGGLRCCAPSNLLFRSYLMAWDPGAGRPVGEILWRSGQTAGPGWGDQFVEYAFDTGGIAVDPGQAYVAFLSAANDLQPGHPIYEFRMWTPGAATPYAGGTGVSLVMSVDIETGADAAAFRGGTWDDAGRDLYFTAGFSDVPPTTVPEPASMALLGTGLAGLVGAARRRRRRR